MCFASYRYFLRWSFVRYQCFSIKTVFDLFPVFLFIFGCCRCNFNCSWDLSNRWTLEYILQIANCMVIFRVCLLLFVFHFLAFIIGISIPTASPTVGLLSFLWALLGWNPYASPGRLPWSASPFSRLALIRPVTTGKSPIRFCVIRRVPACSTLRSYS